MSYLTFRQKFQNLPYISTADIIKEEANSQVMRNQLRRWETKGLIIKLRKGIYVFNDNDYKGSSTGFDLKYFAGQIYGPSYVSMEYALSFYGFIPEGVEFITSITTQKTTRFKNGLGHFMYQHIKPQAFRGFQKIGDEKLPIFMAEPEKAVVDFLYLNLSKFGKNTKDVLEHSYRFQNMEEINEEKLRYFGELFHTKKLMVVIEQVCQMVKEEKL
ncbi:hypothetical protein MNBD_UNCLBAC01-2121 [hydrothermal vent metagenome]|uniref:Transcriptional regulator, AbiEi antitoxin, Type IV TA system n=1 Tax=hydrothermal vent metagenome TaxID=652676 RepID=A0A3B1DGJ7_9ZZZZ